LKPTLAACKCRSHESRHGHRLLAADGTTVIENDDDDGTGNGGDGTTETQLAS